MNPSLHLTFLIKLIISSDSGLEWSPFRTQYRCANLHSGYLQFVDVWVILRSGQNLLKTGGSSARAAGTHLQRSVSSARWLEVKVGGW